MLKRGTKVTDEDVNELTVDMRGEVHDIEGFESVRVVREGGLGAEKGCVFITF